ncbi:MAG: hypothetical protein NEHIOOID_01080 [Holosporales bacterium]
MFMVAPKIILMLCMGALLAQEHPDMKESDLKENNLCLMQEKTTESYYLAGIIYVSKDKWSIWINDQKIQPDQKDQIPFCFRVLPDKIIITHHEKTYTLMCDQTFFPHSQKILNGDQRQEP